jgi:hypothetical protein
MRRFKNMIKNLKCYYCGHEGAYLEKDIKQKFIPLENKIVNAEYVSCKFCRLERFIRIDGKNID